MQLDEFWEIIDPFSGCKCVTYYFCAYDGSWKCLVWGTAVLWWSKLTLLCHPRVPLCGSCIISCALLYREEVRMNVNAFNVCKSSSLVGHEGMQRREFPCARSWADNLGQQTCNKYGEQRYLASLNSTFHNVGCC